MEHAVSTGPERQGPHSTSREKRRFSTEPRLAIGLAIALILVLAALRIPMPLLILEPGPATDVDKLIHIDSATFESEGSFLLSTVLVSSLEGVTLADALSTVFDPNAELVSRQSIFPSGSTRANTNLVHAAQMTESQELAAVAALHELKMPVRSQGVFVREVTAEAPAARVIRPGDVMVAVNDKPVKDPADLLRALEGLRPGEVVKVHVRRGKTARVHDIRTIGADDKGRGKGKARLGVVVVPKYDLPVDIAINAGDIGGPSAGLVFGLAIYDALTPGDLTRGRKIAGTGTMMNSIDKIGAVEPVGGVAEKVKSAGQIGVDVFVVPKANLREAQSAAPEELRIMAVSSLRQAIRALER